MDWSMSSGYAGTPHVRLRMRRKPRQIDTIIIGAGHAGLAMSAQLKDRQVDHVVLEAGDIGQRWRRERWDSLSLLTPNWTLDLPGQDYAEHDPDGFMHKDALASYLEQYVKRLQLPVKRNTRVHRVHRRGERYQVTTTQGEWYCRTLVLASGTYAQAAIPKLAQDLPATVTQVSARDYRNPAALPPGKVLVVGGSATGLQFAQELSMAGREVVLAVGEHVRMPRQLAGRDVYWWLKHSGVLTEQADEVDDLTRARRLPSPQLVGQAGADLNLNRLQDLGVEIVGRLAGISAGNAQFSGNLQHLCRSADLKMQRLLARFSESVPGSLSNSDLQFTSTELARPRLTAALGDEIKVVLWATGFKPDYSWLELDVCDAKGHLMHDGGVVRAPGLYALGLPLMRSRASTFITGAAADTKVLANHLHGYLDAHAQKVAISA